MTGSLKRYASTPTPQSEPLDERQSQNNAGGFSYTLDIWGRLNRFIVLGTDSGTYYINERQHTKQNVDVLKQCLKEDGLRAVQAIVDISKSGRAPKNDQAIFSLAYIVANAEERVKSYALSRLNDVCRIGTHLFQFVDFLNDMGHLSGRAKRRALTSWYTKGNANQESLDKTAYQVIKYRNREGWTHRDVLRIAHPKPSWYASDAGFMGLFDWITHPERAETYPRLVEGLIKAQKATTESQWVSLITEYKLPREALPTEALNSLPVWEALLEDMPTTALVRNLGNMTRIGLLTGMSDATQKVIELLNSKEKITKSKIHPIAILTALKIYQSGHGLRGSGTWNPVPQIVQALDRSFYTAFGNVVPTGKRMLLALDVSGSMGSPIAGSPLTARAGAAAMALVTAAVESRYEIMAFSHKFEKLDINPSMSLADATAKAHNYDFSGTDCALPMIYAQANNLPVDGFVVITDSETWFGNIHPMQALQNYRKTTGINAKLVVMGMTATEFTIGDPNDGGTLDVVGFDAATPNLVSDFIRGNI